MGNAFLYGNGGGSSSKILEDGFIVKAYASVEDLPEVENENTIAVITDLSIPCCTFTRDNPQDNVPLGSNFDQIGHVYILIGSYSPAYFDIVNGVNSMRVYPTAVYQCVEGYASDKRNYVPRDARIYRGGQWVDFGKHVIRGGKDYENVTGGIEAVVEEFKGKYEWAEGSLILSHTGDSGYASIYTNNQIDLREITKLEIDFDSLTHSDTDGIKIGLCRSPYTGTSFTDFDTNMAICFEYCDVINDFGEIVIDLMEIHDPMFDYMDSDGMIRPSSKKGLYHLQIAVQKSSAQITNITFSP